MKALVDPAKPFQAVYALNEIPNLGIVLQSFVIQLTNGKPLGPYQILTPQNVEQFAHRITADDQKLIKVLAEIQKNTLFKQFNTNKRLKTPDQFFEKLPENEMLFNHLKEYKDRRIVESLNLLRGKVVYAMGNNGYPCGRAIPILNDQASIAFYFEKQNQHTLYSIRVTFNKRPILLTQAYIIAYNPAWIFYDNQIFEIEQQVNGKKLIPFQKKSQVIIPKDKEPQYYKGFLAKLIQQHEVQAEGFLIQQIQTKPTFELWISREGQNIYHFELKTRYEQFYVSMSEQEPFSVVQMEQDPPAFYKIQRDLALEKQSKDWFMGLFGKLVSLFNQVSLPEQEALLWLSKHHHTLKSNQILIKQLYEPAFLLDEIALQYHIQEAPDEFVVNATVKTSVFEIPLADLKKNILHEKQEFKLPDGTQILIPSSWIEHLEHLFEVATINEQKQLVLAKHQAPLLQLLEVGDASAEPNYFKDFQQIQETPPPTHLNAQLRDYQKAGFDWLLFLNQYRFGGILADDMGLGKTLQTLSLIQHQIEKGVQTPSLLIMPKSLIYNWIAEIEKFTPQIRYLVYQGPNRESLVSSFHKFHLILTTYGTARRDEEVFANYFFHYIILDESQTIKNYHSQTYQALAQFKSKHKLSLSGTPIENKILDLWAQMHFLNPNLLGSKNFFLKSYAEPIEKHQNAQRANTLKKIIHPFILRRTKEMVAKELPPKIENIHFCEMTDAQAELYQNTLKNLKQKFFYEMTTDELQRQKMTFLTALTQLRQIAIHPALLDYELNESGKLEEVNAMLEPILEQKSKVLIFSQFVKMLNILRKQYDAQGIAYAYIDGSMTAEQRAAQVERFQQVEDVSVFLISLKAGGVGLNLTQAQYVFIIDPWWNPAAEKQAIDRAYRIGQTKNVFSYKFISKNTIEEKILLLQQKKSALAQELIQVEESFTKNLSIEDFQFLLN